MSPAPRVAVLMPAWNEEEALPLVLAELPREAVSLVVVVDNGSTDRTAEVARAGGAVVVREPRRGYGQACLTGIAYLCGAREPHLEPPLAREDVLVFLDADHSDYPADLPQLLAPLLAGRAELVLGSRILGGADRRALLPQAWYGNRLACWLMRLFFRARYTDLGPFRAIRAGDLERLAMSDRGFGWTVEMQLKATALGLATLEVPVRYRARVGRSKITGTVRGTLLAGAKILGWIFAWRIRLWASRPSEPRAERAQGRAEGRPQVPETRA